MTLEYIAASLLDNLYDHISQHWLSVYFMYYISSSVNPSKRTFLKTSYLQAGYGPLLPQSP